MHSGGGDTPSRVPGFPIRKPPDHSSAASSPGHIAGSGVLHRLLMPRHPPCALKNLTLRIHTIANRRLQKMLASTMQFSSNRRNQATGPPSGKTRGPGRDPRPRHQSACFLRTQQRAHPADPIRNPFRSPARRGSVLAGPGETGNRITSAPLDSMGTRPGMRRPRMPDAP